MGIWDSPFWNTSLASALIGLVGAFLGAFMALLVVIIQNKQQQRKEEEGERNKLIYLNFLLDDVYKIVGAYNQQTTTLRSYYQTDPFVIPTTHQYPPHSLEEIALRLKQEEYYLASVHQLKNGSVAEVLRICNTLQQTHKLAIDHYLIETPQLINDKLELERMLEELVEGLNQIVIYTDLSKANSDQRSIFSGTQSILHDIVKQPHALRDSKVNFIDRVIKMLEQWGQETHRPLLIQAYKAQKQYRRCVGRALNVVESMEGNKATMDGMIDSIRTNANSLQEFVKENPID